MVGTADDDSAKRRGGAARAHGQTVVLGLERALHVYAKQQIKAHQVSALVAPVCPFDNFDR